MRKLLWLVIAATSVVASAPAMAQAQSGRPNVPDSREMRRPNLNGVFQRDFDSKILIGKKAQESQYEVADGVAKCLARRTDAAGDLLGGAMTRDPEYANLVYALKRKYSRCATADAAGIPIPLINGALAEELVKSSNPTLEDRAKAVNVSVAEPFYTDSAGRSLDTVGRCLAVYSPGLAMKVLQARIATPAEKAALSALFARTPECGYSVPPSNFSSQEQRGAVAAGLYHWMKRG